MPGKDWSQVPLYHTWSTDPVKRIEVKDESRLNSEADEKFKHLCTDRAGLASYRLLRVDPLLTTVMERTLLDQPQGTKKIYEYILDVLEDERGSEPTPRIAKMEIDPEGFPILPKEVTDPRENRTVKADFEQSHAYWGDTLRPLLRSLVGEVLKERPENVREYLSDLIHEKLRTRDKAHARRAERRMKEYKRQTNLGKIAASEPVDLHLSDASSDEEVQEEVAKEISFRFKQENKSNIECLTLVPNPRLKKMIIRATHVSDEAVWEQQWLFDMGSSEKGQRRLMLAIARALGHKWFVYPTFKLTLTMARTVQRWDCQDLMGALLDGPHEIAALIGENPIVCVVDEMEGSDLSTQQALNPTEKDLSFIDGEEVEDSADEDEENAGGTLDGDD